MCGTNRTRTVWCTAVPWLGKAAADLFVGARLERKCRLCKRHNTSMEMRVFWWLRVYLGPELLLVS